MEHMRIPFPSTLPGQKQHFVVNIFIHSVETTTTENTFTDVETREHEVRIKKYRMKL